MLNSKMCVWLQALQVRLQEKKTNKKPLTIKEIDQRLMSIDSEPTQRVTEAIMAGTAGKHFEEAFCSSRFLICSFLEAMCVWKGDVNVVCSGECDVNWICKVCLAGCLSV